MSLQAADHFRLDKRRMFALSFLCSVAAGASLQVLAGGALGGAGLEIDVVMGVVAFYLVSSLPKRLLDTESLAQSREAPALSLMAAAGITATGSRNRAAMLLSSAEGGIDGALKEIKRLVLLGRGLKESVAACEGLLASYSVAQVLGEMAESRPDSMFESGEETNGLVNSLQLADESKFPLFITVCFFTPVMLLLYSVFSHVTGPVALGELVILQIAIVDVAYHFSVIERRRLS